MFHELQMLYEFQKFHESEINNVFLLLMAFRKFIGFITKTVHEIFESIFKYQQANSNTNHDQATNKVDFLLE